TSDARSRPQGPRPSTRSDNPTSADGRPRRQKPTYPQTAAQALTATPTDTGPGVFSPGRLRAYRDLAGLTRGQLATNTGLPVAVVTAYEEGTAQPTDEHLSTLAEALSVTPGEFTGPPGAEDSWEYWGLICAAMPPMTTEQIASVATVLRRIATSNARL